jgi:protein dithiol oxidoreductase (disulfide-forming)
MNKKAIWTLLPGFFLLAILSSLSACSDAEEGVSEEKIETTPVMKEQTEVITKTIKAESTMQDIADRYRELPTAQSTRTGDKIEVLEVFFYGCPHCYSFEPTIENWLKEKAGYIEFVRMPGVLSKNWLAHARAYYAAEKLGVLDKIHRPLFDAIHRDKRKIIDEKSLKKFFSEQGVSGGDFDQAYKSRDVEDNVREAYLAGQRYQLTGVPAVIINGKYGTSVSMAGGYEKIVEVINTLAAEEYKKKNQ